MENQVLSFEEIKKRFPDEWVLLGNPEYSDDDLDVLSAYVVAHNKDKSELALNYPSWRISFETATCVFTGTFPKRHRSGILIQRKSI
jgi:outer membrane receptor for ferric coprogen and ferric-rhodotorulic acid